VASTYHAGSVELWPPNDHYRGFSVIPTGTLAGWNRDLAAGTPISC